MALDVIVVPDAEAAAARAADVLVERVRAGGGIALAGGSTPRRAYELASRAEPDWSRVELWFGDDRCVPPGDERSNLRLVEESLLRHVAHGPIAVHAVRSELGPAQAAQAYDEELRAGRIDLALLGVGSDGHTASLFPNAPSLGVLDRLAVAADAGLEPFVPRVTMTIHALAAAGHVVFLAVGADKAEPARRAFAASPSPDTPASLVRSERGVTTAILDEAAAALLP